MRTTTAGAFVVLLVLSLALPAAALPRESFWGAKEFYTRKGHLRYLLLFPPRYDPRRTYELWVNLHGSPGCAGHAVYQYREEAARKNVILLAPQGTGDAGDPYIRPDGKRDIYRFVDQRADRDRFLAILDEVLADYLIDRRRVALLGFSAGCEMGWRLLAARPEAFYFFGGVANGFKRGRLPAREEQLRRAARHVPQFYAAGRDDDFAGPMFKPTARKLREVGFRLKTAYPAGVGHALPASIKTPLLAYMDEARASLPAPAPVKAAPHRPSTGRGHSGSVRTRLWAIGVLMAGAVGAGLILLRRAQRRSRSFVSG